MMKFKSLHLSTLLLLLLLLNSSFLFAEKSEPLKSEIKDTSSFSIPPTSCADSTIQMAMTDIYAVTKAYSSCVGAGPFTTELFDEEAEELRKRGGDAGEYGATTGRPRRVGWFDAVATRYGCMVQGATEVVLTNLDVLGYLKEIPVCTAYEVDGKQITDFPSTPTLMRAKPVYTMLPGWTTDIRGETDVSKLPENCRKYIDFMEKQLELPIRMVSTGPKRSELLYRAGGTSALV